MLPESKQRHPRPSVGRFVSVGLAAVLVTISCGGNDGFDYYVGRLDEKSYAGQRWRALGPNGLGEEVELADFEGRFVWVDYSASWCSYCADQARVIGRCEDRLEGKVAFLTVMVDGGEPMTDPTRETAEAWAHRFGLDARMVVAQRIYVGPVPHHFLFSPIGQTLYRESGLHSTELIEATLAEHMSRWDRWASRNDLARR